MIPKVGRMRPFDIELNLPKPEVSRPRIDETYGMLQLAIRFLALLADLGGIAVFVYVGVVWGYVNHFATAAVRTPPISKTFPRAYCPLFFSRRVVFVWFGLRMDHLWAPRPELQSPRDNARCRDDPSIAFFLNGQLSAISNIISPFALCFHTAEPPRSRHRTSLPTAAHQNWKFADSEFFF